MSKYSAVFFDFGGVITSSPFEAFELYEREIGAPTGSVRRVNSINPDDNAWARFERSEIDRATFCDAFDREAAALDLPLSGAKVLACLSGTPRPQMVRALDRLRPEYTIACLTNNVAGIQRSPEAEAEISAIMKRFHHIVASSEAGVRKPEEAFYRIALEQSGVTAEETIFLDDLGVNLKTARAMGMTTIKVGAAEPALAELGALLGVDLLT